MCGSTGFQKTILYVINFLLLLAGLALLVIGVVVHVKTNALTNVIEGVYGFGSVATLVLGGVYLLFAVLGWCGAAKESSCMLITYSIFILVLMLLKLALALVVCFNSNDVIAFLNNELFKTFATNQPAFHQIETALHCCGPRGPSNYSYYVSFLPESCCPPMGGDCTHINVYPGCDSVVEDVVYTSKTAIVGALSVVAALELLAVTTVLCLTKNLRNKKTVY